ncbi:uncharacterized protein TM35_000262250, partial [Trypanosoma theileri]
SEWQLNAVASQEEKNNKKEKKEEEKNKKNKKEKENKKKKKKQKQRKDKKKEEKRKEPLKTEANTGKQQTSNEEESNTPKESKISKFPLFKWMSRELGKFKERRQRRKQAAQTLTTPYSPKEERKSAEVAGNYKDEKRGSTYRYPESWRL